MPCKSLIPLVAVCFAAALPSVGQEKPAPKQPEVHVNYLNACAPSDADQNEMGAILASVPSKPSFDVDFEISRGRTQSPPPEGNDPAASPQTPPIAKWVRIRRELPSGPFTNAQYSFSLEGNAMLETLVFRARDLNKGVLDISLQDTVTAGTPESVLSANTPVDRIRIERSGKSSLVLARCSGADQSKYEPLFRAATDVLAKYRVALAVRQTVPGDLARVAGGDRKRSPSKTKP